MSPYAVLPPRHGSQIRDAGLHGNLGEGWEVEIHSQSIQRSDLPLPRRTVRRGPRLTERRMLDPVSAAWIVGLAMLAHYPAAYADRVLGLFPRPVVRRALADADLVVVSRSHQFAWVRRHTPARTPVVVDSHCIEADLFPARRAGWTRAIAREIRQNELAAWRDADAVLATCREEVQRIEASGARRVLLVPNGVDTDYFCPVTRDQRMATRERLGIASDATVAVFVGSAGDINVGAADILTEHAGRYRAAGIEVHVIGRVGVGRGQVDGIVWHGEVPDVVPWLQAADLALCPLRGGSGTSLKTVEFLGAGLPLVTTPMGVRGLDVRPGVEAVVCDVEEMPSEAAALLTDTRRRERLGAAARELAVTRYSWSVIGHAAAAQFDRLVTERADKSQRTAAPSLTSR